MNVIKRISAFIAIICALAIAVEIFPMFMAMLFFAGIYALIEYSQRKEIGGRL